jgi:hypothetical protein
MASVGLARPAAADAPALPSHLAVEWEAPSSCPDVAHVRTAIATTLGGSTARRAGPTLEARGVVTDVVPSTQPLFRLRIDLTAEGASETRTMEANSCATLENAFALVVAFAFDPSAAPPAPESPLVTPPSPASTPRTPSESAPPSFAVLGGPLLAAGAGALPFPAYGVGGRLAIEAGPRWELGGTFWPEQPASVPVDASGRAGANVWLATVEPSACLALAAGVVAPCLGAEAGATGATGTGIANPSRGVSWWLAPTASLSLRVSLARGVGLRFRVEGGVPVFRPSFTLENVGAEGPVQAFRPAPAFGAVSIEPEFSLFSTERGDGRHVLR